jgi:hypothetical protein
MAIVQSPTAGGAPIDYENEQFKEISQDTAKKNVQIGADNMANQTNANCITALKKGGTNFNPNQ